MHIVEFSKVPIHKLINSSELKGYLKEASKDLSNEVKSWAGSAWGSFNKLLKSRIGVSVGGTEDATATVPSHEAPPASSGCTAQA